MRTIAVAIQKGGVGKTTTAVNLAASLVQHRQRVLLVDVDAQGNATKYLTGGRDDGRALLEVYAGNRGIADVIQQTSSGVDLVPSGAMFASAERLLAKEYGVEPILREALEPVADRYDLAIIDTPPSLGIMMITALAAADDVLMPVVTEALPLEGLRTFVETLTMVRKRINPKLRTLGVLACKVENTVLSRDVEKVLRQHFGADVFKATVRKSVRIAESPNAGKPIRLYAPKDRGAADYEAFAREVLVRLKEAA